MQKKIPTDLPDVVEVSVRDAFQLFQLRHFIHHFVQVEFRGQEVQASVAVGFPVRRVRRVSNLYAPFLVKYDYKNVHLSFC